VGESLAKNTRSGHPRPTNSGVSPRPAATAPGPLKPRRSWGDRQNPAPSMSSASSPPRGSCEWRDGSRPPNRLYPADPAGGDGLSVCRSSLLSTN